MGEPKTISEPAGYIGMDGPDGTIILVPAGRFWAGPSPAPPEETKPTPRRRSVDERDDSLRQMFEILAPRLGSLASSPWASSSSPYRALLDDCRMLRSQQRVADGIDDYLQRNPAVRSAADMLVSAIAMSANAEWRRTPEVVRNVAARGWFIGRWLPTFLVVDGPISRFITSTAFKDQNPRAEIFRAARRLLCQDPIVTTVRNGFAHWSFGWLVENGESSVVIYDDKTGSEKLRLPRRQVEAMHMVAFTIVDILNEVFLRA